jgi:hypothetical protein
MGQKSSVTVEYMLAAGTLDSFIAELLATKMLMVNGVEADTPPDASILRELEARLRATGDAAARIEAIAAGVARIGTEAPIAESGVHEFTSSREPGTVYRVTWGRGGHLECTCEGFRWRGECKHVREVRNANA